MRKAILCSAILAAAMAAQAAEPGLRAGAYAADITPRQWPVRLIGNFGLTLASKAHDPLHARAVVLDDGRTKLAIVLVDSCYVPRALYDSAKKRAAAATGIPAANMLMAATHTHSGPPSRVSRASVSASEAPAEAQGPEAAYVKLLEDQIVESVVQAHKRLQPAEIGWAVRQEPEHLNNRRWWMTPGSIPPNPFGETTDKVRMNPPRGSKDLIKPAGPVDPGFTVVSVRSTAGAPIALLGNYSLHYVGGVPNNQVSADYFGEFARQVAQRLGAGPDFVGILSNGTSGDVNNIDFRSAQSPRLEPFEKIRYVAGKLADSATAAAREMTYQRRVTLAAIEQEFPVRYRKPTPEQVEQARRFLAEPDEKKLPVRAKPYASFALQLHEGPEMADVKLQALRIGDLGVAAIPFEVFTETGLELKAKSPFRTTFTIELANGSYGYLPTPEQHELGGYETWLGTNRVEKQASRKITDALLAMFAKLAAPAASQRDAKPEPTFANVRYGPDERNVLDLWKADSKQPTPLAVFIHGGGFRAGDKSNLNAATLRRLLDAGISVAAINYRFVPKHPLPAPHEDARRAIQFLRWKAKEWNLDKTRVAAFGGSAGAQLCLYLAFHDDMAKPSSADPVERESTRLIAAAPNAAQTTMDMDWWMANIPGYRQVHREVSEYFGNASMEQIRRIIEDISALSLVSKDDPPIFLSYAMGPNDPPPSQPAQLNGWRIHHVNFGIALKKKMDELGLECHLRYPGAQTKYATAEDFLRAKLTSGR